MLSTMDFRRGEGYIVIEQLVRDGPLENLSGGGRSTKKIFAQGKIKLFSLVL